MIPEEEQAIRDAVRISGVSPTQGDMEVGLAIASSEPGVYIWTQGDCNFAARLAQRERELTVSTQDLAVANAKLAEAQAVLAAKQTAIEGMEEVQRETNQKFHDAQLAARDRIREVGAELTAEREAHALLRGNGGETASR